MHMVVTMSTPVPGGKRTALLVFLFAIQFLLSLSGIAGTVWGLVAPAENEEVADGLFLLTAIAHIAFFIFGGVVFLAWIHRTYRNTAEITGPTEYSPAWAVVSNFIPFVNLVRPCTIVQEMWRKSESRTNVIPRNSPVVLFWWLTYLAWEGFFFWTVDQTPDSGALNQTLRTLFLIGEVCALIATALGIVVVVGIRRRQQRQMIGRAAAPYTAPTAPLTYPV